MLEFFLLFIVGIIACVIMHFFCGMILVTTRDVEVHVDNVDVENVENR